MSSSDSSSDVRKEKVCRGCLKMLPLSSFYTHARDGHSSRCRECIKAACQERKRISRQRPDDIEDTDDTESEDPPSKRPCRPSNLYVMCLSTDPGGIQYGLKIGLSCNIEERALALASSLPFDMVVLATIPGAGPVEAAVHEHLALDAIHIPTRESGSESL
mgnify:CR=1 FL=1